ncbi:EAL domain-containing protein [Desulfotomaculum sp. 1211_IL3151]|uniref:EAL domain-containing protein n=1 Tax=Desulfotomaculum sp. 1211_IL3151 TaxID=3084055 RepID=UPI002FD9A1AC
MNQVPLLFSLLFFSAFAIYLLFGLYIIYMNPRRSLNRMFSAVCISLCFWSIGFSVANSAPDLETCLLWRRISALGWGTAYSLMLHFLLLLTGAECSRKRWRLCALLHLPAVVCIYAFAASGKITAVQYNLVKLDSGWINIAIQNGWTTFFQIYYVGYVLACLGVIWRWRQKASNQTIRKQANILLLSMAAALLLGSLTDVILSAALKGSLPQMAPVFTLLPIASIYYCMKRYGLMGDVSQNEDDLILSGETRSKLHFYLSFAFLAGGFTGALAYFLPHMVQGEKSLRTMLNASVWLFFLGAITLLCQLIKNKKVKETIVLIAMLCSIPIITLQFIDFAGITVWAFPLVLMIISLVFGTRIPLIALMAVSVATQLLVWINSPEGVIQLDRFDHIVRISIFLIAFWVGSFVNKTYIKRIKENIYQIEFQKLISDISFNFISVNQINIDEKVNDMLYKIGHFFQVDRAYIFLINRKSTTMTYAYGWCSEGISPETEAIQNVPTDVFLRWLEQLSTEKLVYIEDVRKLPDEASAERELLIEQGVKSVVVIPIEENGELLGFMGLDSVRLFKSWSRYHIELLRILSNLLADGLIKINSEKEIEYMAYYDQLTGLPNRTLFSDHLARAIQLAKRNEKFIGVIFMDLDSFKMVNDTMGHNAGDTLLRAVAQGLAQRLRKTDTVARFGGDEFLILVNHFADNEDVIKVADTIMKMFEHPFEVQGQEFFITGSAGVAVYPFDGDDAETLIKNADIAMYIAKSKGKNQYELCTAEMKDEVKQNIKISNSLYRVQERGELTVYYQPQVKLQTGQITGLEALLRWNHPEMGMIPPNVFIPLAEMNGTINSIGDWVLKTAISQNKRWQEKGFPHLRLAINLSIIQFRNPYFAENLDKLIKEIGLNPKCIELEITESVATKEAGHIVDTLTKLKQLGVSISIDDFGTEYSSLNRLKVLSIDRIKIDMQFVQGIENSEKDRAITKVVINLAKSLGLEVLAEGVETARQLDFLKQKLCDEVQGYYYYKPMPAEEIEKLFLQL